MRYESIGTIDSALLAEFKSYAKLAGTSEDTALGEMLTAALLAVAEYADCAMMSCTLGVDSGSSDVSYLRLYQMPVGQIVSVKNGAGEDVTDYALSGNDVRFANEGRYKVSYTVVPDAAKVRRYKYYAFQIASAMYDGNDEEQEKILRQIPADFI